MKSREPKNRLHTTGFVLGWLLALTPVIAFLPTVPGFLESFNKLGSEDFSTKTTSTGIADVLPAMVVALILCPLGIVLLVVTFLARARIQRKIAGPR